MNPSILLKYLIISILIIFAFVILLYTIVRLSASVKSIDVEKSIKSLYYNGLSIDSQKNISGLETNMNYPQTSLSESNVSQPQTSLSESNVSQLQTSATKQIYNKYDEIILPSSIGGASGYVGRDYVCFRNKIGDQPYVSKRTGCMACQIDTTGGGTKTYAGTNTNIISTCSYADKSDPSDLSLWTKDVCMVQCGKIPDIK